MQWGHIKTLFILSFLILNIYLVSAFINRQQDVGYLDNQELPIEDQLAAENINYDGIQVDVTESTYISVSQKLLTSEEINQLNDMNGQIIEVFNNNSSIAAELETPVSIPENANTEAIEDLIQGRVLYGEEYFLWDWNEELNLLVFFQEKENEEIYYNKSGLLLVYLNEDNEITHYTQTILGKSEVQGDPITLNRLPQVIGILYRGNFLSRGDEVTDVDIGYYSRIDTEGIQVFAPTWKVEINGERNHFVNAIEGIVYESDEFEFLREVINENSARLLTLDKNNDLRASMLKELEKRLEIDNRSETE